VEVEALPCGSRDNRNQREERMRSSWSQRLASQLLNLVLDQCPRQNAGSSDRALTDKR
jgi:hypothetical protein